MNQVYQNLWELAKPFYEKSRPFDLEHIEWMIPIAEKIAKSEKLDMQIFLPLVILHDIGYSQSKDSNFWEQNTRKAHMKEGAKMAKEILSRFSFTGEEVNKIVFYISVHDEWALGNNTIYKDDKLLGIFTDIDFMWMASKKGFPFFLKELNKTPQELIDWLVANEKLTNRPFASKSTKELFYRLIEERKKDTLSLG